MEQLAGQVAQPVTGGSISLAQTAELVSALETVSTEIPGDSGQLTWWLEDVWQSAYQARRADRRLRRR